MNKKLEEEILNILKANYKKADKDTTPILRAYKKALDEVRTDIAKIYVKYAIDGELKVGKRQRYTVLKQLEKRLIEQGRELGLIDLEHTTKILEDIFEESYYRTAYVIDKGIETDINFAILKPEFVKTAVEMPIAGEMFSDRIWKNKELLVNRVRDSIEKAMIQGTSIDKLARDIKRNFGSSAYESQRLIRTEVARCQSLAQNEIYEQSGFVQQVMWVATLESRTCVDCGDLDGKIWDITENYPMPPKHPMCRCTITPIVKNWQPKTRRDQETRQIIPYQTYSEWKKAKGIN